MWLCIRNRNINETTKNTTFNGGCYEVTINEPVVDNFNEELDSTTCIIKTTSEIEIESFDMAVLLNNYNDTVGYKYFCVDTWELEENLINTPKVYIYTISLFSETKLLENVVLPNLSITKVKGRTRSVWFYLSEYLHLYCPQIKEGTSASFSYNIAYHYDETVQSRFTMECPEMQWNRPTLREVINDLMMVDDCIPVMQNREISFFDLSERKATTLDNDSNINYIRKSQSSSDYASELEMELQNVLQDKSDGVYGLNNGIQYLGIRNYSEYIVTTNNGIFYTANPIYNIRHFWLCANYLRKWYVEGTEHTQYKYIEVDLCNLSENGTDFYNLIREEKEWQTLELLYQVWATTKHVSELAPYKNFNLRFTRGGNEITGMYDNSKTWWFFQTTVLETLLSTIDRYVIGDYPSGATYDSPEIRANNKDIFFKIEYESLSNTKFKAGKYLPYRNNKIVADNQTNSYVNANQQGILEYLKANRLGNIITLVNAKYDSVSSVKPVGSTYGEGIVFKTETKINPNFIDTNYYITPNYVLHNYFTGIKSKIRSWQIASGSEATVRNELIKCYYEFSFSNKGDSSVEIAPFKMLSPLLSHFENEIIKIGCLRVMDESYNYYPSNSSLYISELNSKVIGNSIVFNTQLRDNYSVGMKIDSTVSAGTDNYGETDCQYVDNNGEFRLITFYIATDLDYTEGSFTWPTLTNVYNDCAKVYDLNSVSVADNIISVSQKKPIINVSTPPANSYYSFANWFYKDQREIIALTVQLEYCSDTPDIVIGNQFIRDNNLISTHYREKYTYDEVVGTLYTLTYYTTLPTASSTYNGYVLINNVNDNYYKCEITSEPSSYLVLQTTQISTTIPSRASTASNGLYRIFNIAGEYTLYQSNGSSWQHVREPITNEYFKYSGSYYQWSGTALVNVNEYAWVNKGSADGLYFNYAGRLYQYSSTTHSLTLTQDTPVYNAVRTDLKLYWSDDKVRVYDMDYLPANRTLCSNWSISVENKAITINLGTIDKNAYYITDNQNNVLLAFNRQVDTGSTVQIIHLNGLHSRDENIYNTNGNIVGEL